LGPLLFDSPFKLKKRKVIVQKATELSHACYCGLVTCSVSKFFVPVAFLIPHHVCSQGEVGAPNVIAFSGVIHDERDAFSCETLYDEIDDVLMVPS